MKKVIAALLSMSLCLSGTGMMCSAEEVTVNEVVSERQIKILINQIDELEDQIGDLEGLESFDSTDIKDLIKQIETKKITTVEAKNKLDKKLKVLEQETSKSTVKEENYLQDSENGLLLVCGILLVGGLIICHDVSKSFKPIFNAFRDSINNFKESMKTFIKGTDKKVESTLEKIYKGIIDFFNWMLAPSNSKRLYLKEVDCWTDANNNPVGCRYHYK